MEKLGKIGDSIFELMAVCTEKSGIIVSYGKKLVSFIRKITTPLLEGYSNHKHDMIDNGFAPKTLKILGIFFSALSANDFIDTFDIVGMPIPLTDIGEFGWAIIANG